MQVSVRRQVVLEGSYGDFDLHIRWKFLRCYWDPSTAHPGHYAECPLPDSM
ncbi:hypothetical protein SAMN05216275_13375 [Streptosporangium canum]|uniref:Uncharacterized protein n=1 Tax=Streptosporangium canum TaxID=324952 RepID=A0A1I4BYE8_9ACTN|nr:hypothetical protein SAMN05216275_13375 [Streptosporangium canum]